ncbi:MAG: nitrophenyl compound nitroreductase subunit ArsF family protein [Saprospiraceae bacterium]
MKHNILLFSFTLVFVFLFSCMGNSQATKISGSNGATSSIEVIQFHSEHRCVTCNLIEKLTRETLIEHFPNTPFKLVNVDDNKNEKIAEEFEATGTALFIYNPKSKKKKDLTDFAFMNAKNKPEDFKKGIKREVEQFLKN